MLHWEVARLEQEVKAARAAAAAAQRNAVEAEAIAAEQQVSLSALTAWAIHRVAGFSHPRAKLTLNLRSNTQLLPPPRSA